MHIDFDFALLIFIQPSWLLYLNQPTFLSYL
jgi:hypothetical protein